MHVGSCSRQQMPSTVSYRSACRATSTFLPVVLALVLLPFIAFASPSDPSWIAGIYDGADGDDIVTLVDDIAGVEAASPPVVPRLHCSFHQLLTSKSDVDSGFSSSPFSRGPPWASALLSPMCARVSPPSPASAAPAVLKEGSVRAGLCIG
jgi:hypothetical protein